MCGGIAARANFRYTKGRGDAHAANVALDLARKFLLLPTKGTRYELDLSLILFGLAHNRGLFTEPLDGILSRDSMHPDTDPTVASESVFVAVDHSGNILPETNDH